MLSIRCIWYMPNSKIFICACFLWLLQSNTAFCQAQKGDFIVGGGFGLSQTKREIPYELGPTFYRQTSVSFVPKIGYFFTPRLYIGLTLDINYLYTGYKGKTEDTSRNIINYTSENKKAEAGTGIFISYLYPIDKQLFWYSNIFALKGVTVYNAGLAGMFSGTNTSYLGDNFTKFYLTTGIQYFISPKTSLTAGLNIMNAVFKKNYYYPYIYNNKATFFDKSNLISIGLNFLLVNDENAK